MLVSKALGGFKCTREPNQARLDTAFYILQKSEPRGPTTWCYHYNADDSGSQGAASNTVNVLESWHFQRSSRIIHEFTYYQKKLLNYEHWI